VQGEGFVPPGAAAGAGEQGRGVGAAVELQFGHDVGFGHHTDRSAVHVDDGQCVDAVGEHGAGELFERGVGHGGGHVTGHQVGHGRLAHVSLPPLRGWPWPSSAARPFGLAKVSNY
jgi:hypothetical protein